MTENKILTSYLDKSYFVASRGGYVASIQAMSCDKLKQQVRQQFLSRDRFIFVQHNFHVALEVMLQHDWETSRCCNRCIFSLIAC